MLSREQNGAAGVGNIGQILPMRVRTRGEDVVRTGSAVKRFAGKQPVRTSNGRNGEASPRYSAGRRVGRSDVRASTRWAKHLMEPPGSVSGEGVYGQPSTATLVRGAVMRRQWRSFRPDEVLRRPCPNPGGVNAIYKAKPKRCVMRRICEAVSGSTDSGDGSRAVVASLQLRGVKRETVSSEHAVRCVDKGKLAVTAKATKWPARPLWAIRNHH